MHPVGDGVEDQLVLPAQRLQGRRPLDEVGGARDHLAFEHLAVLVIGLAVGLEAQQVPDPHAELGAIHGLAQEVLGPGTQPQHPRLAIVHGGDHDDGDVPCGGVGLDPGRHLGAVQPGHPEVEQDQVERLLRHHGERFLAAGRGREDVAFRGEHHLEQLPVLPLVVHDQDACRAVRDVRPGARLRLRLPHAARHGRPGVERRGSRKGLGRRVVWRCSHRTPRLGCAPRRLSSRGP